MIGFAGVFHYHDETKKMHRILPLRYIILSHLYLRKNWRQISRFRFCNDNDKYSDRPSCVFLLQISKNPILLCQYQSVPLLKAVQAVVQCLC